MNKNYEEKIKYANIQINFLEKYKEDCKGRENYEEKIKCANIQINFLERYKEDCLKDKK